MGYAMCWSQCIRCERLFGYNPHKVPSVRIDGVRQPICRECIPIINEMRKQNGVDPIIPHPDAYEAIDEREL